MTHPSALSEIPSKLNPLIERAERARDFMVLLYDLERYGGESRAPNYLPGDARFFLNAFGRSPGQLFHSLLWTASAKSHDCARALVPSGGAYFDRTGNYPSPMVPIEGWHFAAEPLPPPTGAHAHP